jgi:hypothetical protein
MAQIVRDVWFFLIQAEVTGAKHPGLICGERVFVQCFSPGHRLESCLTALDQFLQTEDLRRIDTLRAVRYEADGQVEEYPGDFFRKPLEVSASTDRCTLGVFFASSESSPSPQSAH